MAQRIIGVEYQTLIKELKKLVTVARYKAALSVNKELIIVYHTIGTQILESQANKGWGARIIDHLSKDLQLAFPEMKGFGVRNLKYMRKFAEEYSDPAFVNETCAQLTWYHMLTLLEKISDKHVRAFYIEKAIEHHWSRNTMVNAH